MDFQRIQFGDDEFAVISIEFDLSRRLADLTAAEHEVAERLLRGETNCEIARGRGTATRTVANQVAAIYEKFKVNSRAEFLALFQDILVGDMNPR